MAKKPFNIIDLVNSDGCFDLQFRKDTRHERTNSPTYYRWKAQFIVTTPKNKVKDLKLLQNKLNCGTIILSQGQARFAVQKINDIANIVVPYFKKNTLSGNKKKEFDLWEKGVNVIFKNKGQQLSSWKKFDICTLIQVHKSSAKYKNKPRTPKWLEIAKSLTKAC